MWRAVVGVLVASVAVAHAAPPDADLTAALKAKGWTDGDVLLDESGVRVVTAAKGKGKRHVVLVSGAAVRDLGAVPEGTVTAVIGPTEGLGDPLVEVQVHARTARANDGYDETSQSALVRADGTIACSYEGPSMSSSGTACGSGGWTSATTKLTYVHGKSVAEVTYEMSGTWSEADGKGGCLTRSPVRSGPLVTRYRLDATKTCKKLK